MQGARKSSFVDSRSKLGEPYQLYTEVVNTGKTVQGTKKKVRWLFGFTESSQEYEVVFIMSYVSGKKTIYEDGKEIVSVTNMLNTDFTHGWSSFATQRLYRIEVNLNFSSDPVFIFSIDGVAFIDFPQKPSRVNTRKITDISYNNNSRYGDEVLETSATRRSSASSTSTAPNSRVQSHNLNNNSTSQDFDPFATKAGQGAFDPFAEDFGGSSASSTVGSSQQQQQKKSTPAGHGRASIINAPPAEKPRTIEKKPSAAASLFDEVPTTNATSANSFEFFESDPGDPFATPVPAAKAPTKATAQQQGFDLFSTSEPPATLPVKSAPAAAAAFDPFGDDAPPAPPAATKKPSKADLLDPFASSAPVATNHHASAQEISQDFSGLSFTSAPAPPVATAAAPQQGKQQADGNGAATTAPPPVSAASEQKLASTAPKDPWQTNLVDLDLTGKATPMRRGSAAINQGPSLDNLMGHHPAPRSSFVGGNGLSSSSDPFAPSPMTMTHGPPMGSIPQMPRPMSAADAISSLGAVPPPINTHGMYGMGMGSGSGLTFASPTNHNVRGSISQQHPMGVAPSPMAGGPMGGMMGAPRPIAGGSIMSGGYGGQTANVRGSINIPQPQQAKSSLDTIDWRNG